MVQQKQSIARLKQTHAEAVNEVNSIRADITAIPGHLTEIERRLKTSTSEEVMRQLIARRARLHEDAEVKPLLLPDAQRRRLRAEAAVFRAQAEEASRPVPAAVQVHEEAKATLEIAIQKEKLAGKERGRLQNEVAALRDKAEKLEAEAERVL
jgi:hypothetical protein